MKWSYHALLSHVRAQGHAQHTNYCRRWCSNYQINEINKSPEPGFWCLISGLCSEPTSVVPWDSEPKRGAVLHESGFYISLVLKKAKGAPRGGLDINIRVKVRKDWAQNSTTKIYCSWSVRILDLILNSVVYISANYNDEQGRECRELRSCVNETTAAQLH